MEPSSQRRNSAPHPNIGCKQVSNPCVEETQLWAEVENNQGLFLARFFLVLVSTDYSRSHQRTEGPWGVAGMG